MIRGGSSIILLIAFSFVFGQQQKKTSYYDIRKSSIKEEITLNPITKNLEGPYVKYHQNGKLAISGYYSDNLPDSTWVFYFESGSIKSKGQYKNGDASGFWKTYYENGNVKNKGGFINANQAGKWSYYFENGNLKLNAEYKNGAEINNWTYYFESGPLKANTRYDDSSIGQHTTYYYSGEIASEGSKKGLSSEGNWTFFYKNGAIKSSGNFLNGKKEGEWIYYYQNGQIQAQGSYHIGKKNNEWYYFHENGSLESKGLIEEDLRDGEWTVYNEKGQVQSISQYRMGTGPFISYHQNGQVASTGFMKDGLMDSSWVYFDSDGNKIGIASYSTNIGTFTGLDQNGSKRVSGILSGAKKIGEWTIYDRKGTITGTYHPYYDQKQIKQNKRDTTASIEASQTIFYATKSDYGYHNRINRYFDEVINEFDGWILSSNPLLFLINRLPVSVEYYQQERLGYELIYEHLRSPFSFDNDIIGIEEVYYKGHSFSFRQKFYSKASEAGMYYFGHQVKSEILQYGVKTQERTGFRNILTSTASENTFTYGWMLGWKVMKDAGDTGLSIDAYTGINIGISSWQLQKINDEPATSIFLQYESEPLIFPVSFGLNIGWTYEKSRKKNRRG